MKTLSAMAAALLCVSLQAQTNIPVFTKIETIPSPVLSNDYQITLDITNVTPNLTYGLIISRRLPDFSQYITFASPSNSITIIRQTSKSIPIRFYRTGPSNFVGFVNSDPPVGQHEESYWDTNNLPCEDCDIVQEGGGGDGGPPIPGMFRSLFGLQGYNPFVVTDPQILDIIMPPPLRRK